MPTTLFQRAWPVLLALGVASCGITGSRSVPVDREPRITGTGVTVELLHTGLGPVAFVGDEIVMDYRATLLDGTLVDSTYDRGLPMRFRLGEAPLPCWDDALPGVRAGARLWLTVPPERAYGAAGVPGLIPSDAVLRFEVEVLELHPAPGASAGS